MGCTPFAVDRGRPAARTLPGPGEIETGAIGRDPDLRQVLSDAGTTYMDQKIDEVGFDTFGCAEYYDGPFVLRWDLDVDGSFETTGTSVTLDARAFDGPSVVSVPALAQDASTARRVRRPPGSPSATCRQASPRSGSPTPPPIR